MSSSSTGLPMRMAFSIVRSMFPSVRRMHRSADFASMLFTHRFAWPCGSIINGHRFPRVTSTPLSTLTESVGKPNTAHSRVSMGELSVRWRLKFSVTGILRSLHSASQLSTISLRYVPVKAP